MVRLGYSVGFLIVILGRQQLFTENTLTPVLSLLARRDARTLWRVGRLWGIVLAANLIGGALFALAMEHTGAATPETKAAFHEIGVEAATGSFGRSSGGLCSRAGSSRSSYGCCPRLKPRVYP